MKKVVPDYRVIETQISLGNIKDQVAALLYAAGLVNDDEDVLDIEFNGWKKGMGLIPIVIKVKKHQEVEVIKIN